MKDVSWISANFAAKVILKTLDSTEMYLHLVNPNRVSWSELIGIFATLLDIRVTSYEEWLKSLISSIPDGKNEDALSKAYSKRPALQLLQFFRSARIGEGYEPLGLPTLSCERLLKTVEYLNEAPRLSRGDVEQWITYWKATGFL